MTRFVRGQSGHVAEHNHLSVGTFVSSRYASIQEAINACAAGGGGTVYIPPGVHTVERPLDVRSGVLLKGAGVASSGSATVIKLANGANCSAIRTPFATTRASIHYAAVESICFDGNADNQTVESTLIDFRGVFVSGWMRNVMAINAYGRALHLQKNDITVDNFWAVGTVAPTTQAILIGDQTDTSETTCVLTMRHIFVENTANEKGASVATLRADPTKRGEGVRIERVNRVSIDGLHCESNAVDVTVGASVKLVVLTGSSSGWTDPFLYFEGLPRAFVVNGVNVEQVGVDGATLIGRDESLSAFIDEVSGVNALSTWSYG